MTGQELIERMAAFLSTYVVLSPAQSLVLALWCAHTWVYERFNATPYLEIMAATKRSGKTTLGMALSMLSQNGKMFATIRPLTIVRMIEALEGRVTVFIDEAEKLGQSNLDETRTMLATGYQKGQMHAVSVGSKFMEFPTYCPKAFMLIGNVQDVIRDRCIPIYLERGTPQSSLSLSMDTAEEQAGELIAGMKGLYKTMQMRRGADDKPRFDLVDPDWLHSPRDRQIWTPLFTLARAFGLHADTFRALQAASVDLSQLKTMPRREYHSAQDEQTTDDRDAAAHVLADLVSVLKDGETWMPSADAVDRLRAIPTAPWRSWRGDGLNAITLAALLQRYGIETKYVQIKTGPKTRKGLNCYSAAALQKAHAGK